MLWLTNNIEEWLLVLDNADDPSINLHDWIPECDHGNIIITTRNPGLCGYAGSDSLVSDMQEEDAVALLLKTGGQKATAQTEQIAAEIIKVRVELGRFKFETNNLLGIVLPASCNCSSWCICIEIPKSQWLSGSL